MSSLSSLSTLRLRNALQRAALTGLGLVVAACGGNADAPEPPDSQPPVVVTAPADQSVVAPATATFDVTATGSSLSYEWQSSSDAGVTFSVVPGAPNAASLAVANTTAAQSGQRYRVRVSNGAGSVTSGAALLTVTVAPAAPAFGTQPLSQSIVAGASASFTVAVTGTPPPTLQWRLNGASLGNGTIASSVCAGAVATGATSPTLTVTTVPIGCSGAVFSAVASNGVSPDATSNGATLTVTAALAAPVVTLQPGNASVALATSATFVAGASGTPTPTVQWQLSIDGGLTWVDITGATSSTYTTPATVTADNGKRFRAVFTNASGSVTSNAAVLTLAAALPVNAFPSGVAVDSAGSIYTVNADHTILQITSAGVVTTFAGSTTAGNADGSCSAARFRIPNSIAFDAAGNLYVSDQGNHTIRKITPACVVSTLAGTAGASGSADGTGAAARFNFPEGIAVDAAGNVYVADRNNQTIRVVTPAGVVTTLAGSVGLFGSIDGTGSAARFVNPYGIAVDAAGNVYVGEANWTVRKITPAGVVTTLAGLAGSPGAADGTGSAARFHEPYGLAVDSAANVYVADRRNKLIRRVTPAGVVTTLAGSAGLSGLVDGSGSAARFGSPGHMTIDAAGDLFVPDTSNKAVRKVTPAGVVTTVAR